MMKKFIDNILAIAYNVIANEVKQSNSLHENSSEKPSTDGRGQKINMSKRHFYANIRFLGEGIAQTIMCIVAIILNFYNQPLTRFCKPHSSATKSVSPVGRDNLMFLNYIHSGKRAAFSLIEALVILLIISLTIMLAIPLLTQKLTIPGWYPVRKESNNAVSTLNYGRTIGERIGIGTGVKPFASATEGKLVVNSMAIKNIDSIANNNSGIDGSITWGMRYNNNQYSNPNYQLDNQTKSIIIGNNTCENQNQQNPRNSIHIVTHTPPAVGVPFQNQCAANTVNIQTFNNAANTVAQINSTGDSNLTLSTSGNTSLSLNDNDVTVRANGIDIFSYNSDDDTLTISNTLDMTGKDLYLRNKAYNGFTPDDPDDPSVKGSECLAKQEVKDEGSLSGEITTVNTYCRDARTQGWVTLSDKRLKNIISNYTKGLKELYKVDTYTYTFKSDKKQSLSVGILAQKLKGVFDEALHKDNKGYYSYEKEPLLYAMVNAVKSINQKQLDTQAAQKRMNEKADKLIRMYK